jgi:flagellin
MVVQHNLSAMNANRMYNLTQASLSSSTEKLSSGYRINSAADDASGLSISEKMRKQIRGLTQASSNAEDGISMVQTAEGALSEVQDMLQRMNELAVKAANGTNSETDRGYIQDEIDQLTTEIDRVSTTTKFNETYLLNGTKSDTTTYNKATSIAGKIKSGNDAMDIDGTNGSGTLTADEKTDNGDSATTGKYTTETFEIDGTKYVLVKDPQNNDSGTAMTLDETKAAYLADNKNDNVYTDAEEFKKAVASAVKTTGGFDSAEVSDTFELTVQATTDVNADLSISLHVGADSADDNKITVNIANLSAKGLGINGINVKDDDGTGATQAIDKIADAIQQVSTQRSYLGAVQNRLEHTINNLDNVVENTTSAESQIRDTDMATEMVKYSNANILSQAGQSMLAQANQSNQGVLSLLG